jgi:acetamidase/formamidase
MIRPVTEHTIDPARIHHSWDSDLEPALTVASGDVVHYSLKMAGDGQLAPGMTYADTAFDFDTLYNLVGPLHVDGAEPGDTLEIEILALATGDWGWTVVDEGLGLLPEDFPDPYVRFFDLTQGDTVTVCDGVQIKKAPFLGTMGNHLDDPRQVSAFPPHKGAGNIDTRHLVTGASLYLPVYVDGGRFSCGDPHAAQGDGEVCVSGIETAMEASLRFTVHKERSSAPWFFVPDSSVAAPPPGGYYGTTGIDPDLMQGAKAAVRNMIELLGIRHGLTREDAYVLCSLAGDLKIHEIVDAGVWNVGMTMPRSVFTR